MMMMTMMMLLFYSVKTDDSIDVVCECYRKVELRCFFSSSPNTEDSVVMNFAIGLKFTSDTGQDNRQ